MYLISKVNYKKFRKISFLLFITALILSCLVFIPGIGFEHGGAKRWINILGQTFQPSELLKLTAIMYFSALLASFKDKVSSASYGLTAFLMVAFICGTVLFFQPDLDTLMVLCSGLLAVYVISGAKARHIILIISTALIFTAVAATLFPYVGSRLSVFLNSAEDASGSGYQIRQAMIAVGTGGLIGKGFGQSSQKFGYLPEPIGDSIFAVYSEEFGFIGSSLLVILFLLFALRSFHLSGSIPDTYGKCLIAGISTMIVMQAFINISAMIKVFPLSGITLPFVSHGGTALLITLAEAGIILAVSRHASRSLS
jgi:cell division protein FtsW